MSLSDKAEPSYENPNWRYYAEVYVKEFIKLLKKRIRVGDSHKVIDKLAGEKLI